MNLPDKAVIACIHLLPTPGSPRYGGDVDAIYERALREAEVFLREGADALLVENAGDLPFYPQAVPAETVAMMAGVTREIVRSSSVPVGVAVLRNDAHAAVAVAVAAGARFVRVNVHAGAVLAAQGMLTGSSHETMRLRRTLQADVAVLADAGVKHSQPFAYPDLATEVRDLTGLADGIIVSGELTGLETAPEDLIAARSRTKGPVYVGSGVTPDNVGRVRDHADGFIVGSYFKVDGLAANPVDEGRVQQFMKSLGRG
ncbi:BtpA/SgcQ family protein [Nonomuraea sp. NPDC050663]|uniref:BtpA/SgcQ family protein n=1 Tax=Nonomuraea sp. NPDC050663 TaxID=3364370 RepID=UPI00378AAE39